MLFLIKVRKNPNLTLNNMRLYRFGNKIDCARIITFKLSLLIMAAGSDKNNRNSSI